MNELDRSILLLLLLAIVGAVKAEQTTTDTGKPKPVGFECDFEKDTCGWKQTSDSNVDWSRLIAGTGYGPDIDQLVYIYSSYLLNYIYVIFFYQAHSAMIRVITCISMKYTTTMRMTMTGTGPTMRRQNL